MSFWAQPEEPVPKDAVFNELAEHMAELIGSNPEFRQGKLNAFQAYHALRIRKHTCELVTMNPKTTRVRNIMWEIVVLCYGKDVETFCEDIMSRLDFKVFDPKQVDSWFPCYNGFNPLDVARMAQYRSDYDRSVDGDTYANPLPWRSLIQEAVFGILDMLSCGFTPDECAHKFGVDPSLVVGLKLNYAVHDRCMQTRLIPPSKDESVWALPGCYIM